MTKAECVIAGRIEAAVRRRRRALHSGRIVISKETSADPVNTAVAKPISQKLQFMRGGLVGNRRCGNPLGGAWTSPFLIA